MARSPVVAALLAGAAMVACAPGASTASGKASSGTPRPPAGSTFAGARFSTVVPAGWEDKLDDAAEVQRLAADGSVVYLVEQNPPGPPASNVNDVVANLNVVVLTDMVPDDALAGYLDSVSASGASNLSAARAFTIDGSSGQYVDYQRDIQGTPGESRDMVVNHGGSTYHIVLNASRYAFSQQLAGLQAVLAAWRWSPTAAASP